ncbi:hypothetical protein H4R22_000649 [Coemansia sp. RSA 1290]|nr:hypothetical protein H4R22_000649 [Coemansia sp. RSA 1290]KAJ2647224.1 hypothetical protein IWW40_004842 [Coemansia sp. RSA 1250]
MASIPQYKPSDYQVNRPRYKESLVEFITSYHKANLSADTKLCVDVGTGTGIFARRLTSYFDKVIGTDISESMLETARQSTTGNQIEFINAPSEDLSFLKDHSVDVLTAATGAHYFDSPKFVAEAQRVLKPSGTLAIFGYNGLPHFVDYPQCDQIARHYFLDNSKLGAFWSSGYNVVVNMYRCYHQLLQENQWSDVRRYIFPATIKDEPSTEFPPICSKEPVVMHYNVTWQMLENFWQTSSGVVHYAKLHPDQESLAKTMVREMMQAVGATDMNELLDVQWEEVLLMGHPSTC